MIQSAYNTNPPIHKTLTEERVNLFGHVKQNGRIMIGERFYFDYNNMPKDLIENIYTALTQSYQLGYGEASTYFLDKKNEAM